MSAITKRLQFGTVEIRYYPSVLSDNPGGSYGPPIELGWEYFNAQHSGNVVIGNDKKMKLSAYEKERQGKRNNNFYLSHRQRECMLREAGYTEEDLTRAIRRKNSVRHRRNISNLLMDPITRLQKIIQCETQTKKLGKAKTNLQSLSSDGMFHEHSAIYDGWWITLLIPNS